MAPTGHFRFRRSFGNVGSRFRGARPDTYPLFSGILDQYAGAAAAYSLRALSSAWLAGDVVEVRRSSDSTTQSFTASQIDSGAMVDFVNSNSTSLYNDIMYFDGVDDFIALSSTISLSVGDYIEASAHWTSGTRLALFEDAPSIADFIYITESGSVLFRLDGTIYTHSLSATEGEVNTVRLTRTAASSYSLSINGNSETKSTASSAINIRHFGGTTGIGLYFKGLLLSVAYNSSGLWTNTGITNGDWADQIGSNNGTVNGSPDLYTGQPYDGFVSTWYDQSGNGNDATQATTTAQPKIVDAGALVTGGLDFDGVDDWLQYNGLAFSNGLISIFIARTLDAPTTTAGSIFDAADDNAFSASNGFRFDSRSSAARFGTNSALTTFANTSTSEQLQSGIKTSTDRVLYLDGAQVASDAVAGNVDFTSVTQHKIGAITATGGQSIGAAFLNGQINEIIVYNTDQSANRTGIETNINDHYSIY